ncbi:hypothetical protein C5167_020592 [Papaver somniferum]|uniref:Uncharacterized protein n=1 Tax=Papaver somniferum TaxID=3469 RepID=A0A4Y7ITF2_PAPSO|nr:hypothetical protein C5167_020592 [Papaver somniferum]
MYRQIGQPMSKADGSEIRTFAGDPFEEAKTNNTLGNFSLALRYDFLGSLLSAANPYVAAESSSILEFSSSISFVSPQDSIPFYSFIF